MKIDNKNNIAILTKSLSVDGIIKKTSSLGTLMIKLVDKRLAKEMIIKNHYSHKWNDGSFGLYNFGIFHADEPNRCLGVAVYGYMKNPKAKIFTHPNPKAWMCELNRMWIADELGHNAESILIAASLNYFVNSPLIALLCRVLPMADLAAVRSTKLRTSNTMGIILQNSCVITAVVRWCTVRYSLIPPLHPVISGLMLECFWEILIFMKSKHIVIFIPLIRSFNLRKSSSLILHTRKV